MIRINLFIFRLIFFIPTIINFVSCFNHEKFYLQKGHNYNSISGEIIQLTNISDDFYSIFNLNDTIILKYDSTLFSLITDFKVIMDSIFIVSDVSSAALKLFIFNQSGDLVSTINNNYEISYDLTSYAVSTDVLFVHDIETRNLIALDLQGNIIRELNIKKRLTKIEINNNKLIARVSDEDRSNKNMEELLILELDNDNTIKYESSILFPAENQFMNDYLPHNCINISFSDITNEKILYSSSHQHKNLIIDILNYQYFDLDDIVDKSSYNSYFNFPKFKKNQNHTERIQIFKNSDLITNSIFFKNLVINNIGSKLVILNLSNQDFSILESHFSIITKSEIYFYALINQPSIDNKKFINPSLVKFELK